MNNTITIEARRFPVTFKDGNGMIREDTFILTKTELQAAQLIRESSKEIIHRAYRQKGYRVLDIGKAEKKTLIVGLDALWGMFDS